MTARTVEPGTLDSRSSRNHVAPSPEPPDRGSSRRPPGLHSSPARKRQAPWIALGLLLVFGAALSFAAWSRASSTKVAALVVIRDIDPGETLSASALRTEQVQVGSVVPIVGPAQEDLVVGRVARGPIPSGTLINRSMVSGDDVVPPGHAVVGAVLAPGAYPSASLTAGDRVDLVATATTTDRGVDVASLGTGRVWAVSEPDGPGAVGLFVSIRVPADRAAAISNAAGQQRLRLVLVGAGA
jgi:hypothetical protein